MIEVTKTQYEQLVNLLHPKRIESIYGTDSIFTPNKMGYVHALRSTYYRIHRAKGLPDPEGTSELIDILVKHPLFFGGAHQNAILI